jgi:hypothetical protein
MLLLWDTSCIILYSLLLFYPSSCMLLFVTLRALFYIPSRFFIPIPACFSFLILPALFLNSFMLFYPSSCMLLFCTNILPRVPIIKQLNFPLFSYPSFVLFLFSSSFLSPFSFPFHPVFCSYVLFSTFPPFSARLPPFAPLLFSGEWLECLVIQLG